MCSCVGGFTLINTHGSTPRVLMPPALMNLQFSTSHLVLQMSDFYTTGSGKTHGEAREEIICDVSES